MIKHNGYVLIRIECDWEEFYMWRGNELNYTYGKNSEHTDSGIMELPPGNYQIIGLAKDLVGSQMKDICEYSYEKKAWRTYNTITPGAEVYALDTANQSFKSILASHSLEPNQTLVLKENNL